MLSINLICVGRMRETHYIAAFNEYEKRLKPYCKFELTELPEIKLPQDPSQAEIEAGQALLDELTGVLGILAPKKTEEAVP